MAHEKKIRFLIDENVSLQTADQLKRTGYDVIRIRKTKRTRLSDYQIAAYAASNNMIVVTLDKDFAKIYHLTMRFLNRLFKVMNWSGVPYIPL